MARFRFVLSGRIPDLKKSGDESQEGAELPHRHVMRAQLCEHAQAAFAEARAALLN
jgi:hypothetical protein